MSQAAGVYVTGATGFIGGRLVERLVLERGAKVRVGLHRLASAANLARFPVEFTVLATVEDDTFARSLEGCDVVYHCAHDWSTADGNVVLAERLVTGCARARVRRLLYLSSFAAYFPLGKGQAREVTEQTPWHDTWWDYAASKRETTRALLDAGAAQGVEITVLEPPCVYGPFSVPFTIVPVRELRSGRVVIPHDDEAVANLLYVDDLVDAMLSAADHPAAAGERLIINGPEPVPWSALYDAYAAVVGQGEIVQMGRAEVEALSAEGPAHSAVRRVVVDARYLLSSPALGPLRVAVRRGLGDRLWQRSKGVAPLPLLVPDRGNREFRWSPYVASHAKASRVFGYEPRFALADGLTLSAEFLRWARL